MADLAVAIVRGGTSKGVFIRLDALPAGLADRDRLLLRLMGSPDPMQLDGLGGTHSSTSKVMAVGPSGDPSCAVDYLFAQVAVDQPVVDTSGNCGNLTAGVAHYAVEEGLVPATEPQARFLMRNLNTGVVVRATVAVRGGRACSEGDTVIDGVPGSGAALATEYLDPAGSVTGALFPTGQRCELLDGVEVSIVDVATPYLFAAASSFGLTGAESPAELNARPELLARLESLRGAAGRRIGVDSLAVPRLVLCSPGSMLRVQATSMGKVHHALPMTGALCTGAAMLLEGTVAHRYAAGLPEVGDRAGAGPGPVIVRIEHPKGSVETSVELAGDVVRAAGVIRTARRLLTGTAHL
ncbi:MAG: 4-oxalomesaconate tautomerase [Acidimicrobiales bacterium]|nr:4-oxalomesaconate tautomerase [Acidimicrobiales bacterium]